MPDTLTTIYEGQQATTGTSGSGGGGSGDGVTLAEGDARWLNESENGADIPNVATFRDNIGLGSTDDVTFGSATLSDLTSGRVVYAGADGLLTDSANFLFDGTNVDLPNATFGSAHALTGSLGDARYGQLDDTNTWNAVNTFTASVLIDPDADVSRTFNLFRGAGASKAGLRIEALADTGAVLSGRINGSTVSQVRLLDDEFRVFIGDLRFDSNLTAGGTTVIDSSRNLFAAEGTFSGDVEKDDFALTTDFDGTGWQGTSAGDFNIRNLIVRESARFRELIIDQLSIIAGSDLLSVARGKIASIDTGSNTITIEDPNDRGATRFVVNDFFWVKSVDIDNSTIVDLKGQITAVSGTTLTLDTTVTGGTHDGATTDITSLTVGDVIAQRGHPSNADRQSLIYRTVSDSDAPVEKFFDGIDSLGAFDTASNIVVEIGPTSGHFGANNILTYAPDEVGLASFTATSDWLTDGEVTIGRNIQNATTGLRLGIWDSGTEEYPYFRLADSSGNLVVQLLANNSAQGAIFRDLSNNIVAQFGSSNFVAGWQIEEGKFYGGETVGEYTGLQSGDGTTRAFFAGADDSDGTNATFFVTAEGRIFSDAASDVVWSRTELAAFSTNAGASSITNEEWEETINRNTNGTSTNEHNKIITVSKKRFSKDSLIFTGVGRQASTGSGTATVERDVEIRASISSVSGAETASGSTEIVQTSDEEFSFTVDISSIPDDDLMLIEISIWVSVSISNSDAVTYGTEGFLREDVAIMTAT